MYIYVCNKVQIVRSLSKCSGESFQGVLGLADAELLLRANDLSAEMLLSLAEALDTLKKGGWLPSQALLKKARRYFNSAKTSIVDIDYYIYMYIIL